MKQSLNLLALLLIAITTISAQTYDGYTLYSKMGNNKAYLLKMDKTIYHTWTCSPSTGYSTYLLPNHHLLRSANYSGNQLNGPAMTGMVQDVDWNGTVTWQYIYSTSTYCAHHDIHPMPNGNVLLIVYEVKSPSEVTQAGCSQSITMWPDKIVEIQPSGTNAGTVVWEWHAWDHLCQNYNASKSNYVTSISQHPELLNINYGTQKDWMHTNGIDYNAELDQIVISSHYLNEIYVIDHSTTTAEAASHSGGNSGKGGDILYRWGNPQVYSCGTSANQDFKVVHDAHWVPAGCPNANDLVGFNNQGAPGNHSCIDRVTPPYNGYNYSTTLGSAFSPSVYTWRHVCLGDAQDQSNSQQLPNGNTLICISSSGYIYEIDANQNVVWSHTLGGTVPKAFRYSSCYVNGNPTVDVTANPAEICQGSSSQLNANVTSGTATSYSWTSNPPGFTSTLQNPSVAPLTTTSYYGVASGGGCSATDSVVVTVTNPMSVTVSASLTSICPGQSSQLNAEVTGASSVTYSWSSNPAGFTSNLQNPTVSPTVNTSYFVTASNGNCSSVSTPITITVNMPFSLQANAEPSSICFGESSNLSVSVTGGTPPFSINWSSNPSGFSSTISNPLVQPTATTVYTVLVSDGICSLSTSVPVNVNGPLNINASATPALICAGNPIHLSANVSGGTTYSFSWSSVPAGFSSTLQNPVVYPGSNTTYFLNVQSSPCEASDSLQVEVNPLPATPLITHSGDTLYSTAESGNQWYFDSALLNGSTGQFIVPVTSGNYQVQVTGENGCKSALSQAFEIIVTSLEETENDVLIYPNPVSGILHFALKNARADDWVISMYDFNGKSVVHQQFVSTLDLSSFVDGMYCMLINVQGKPIIKRKIVVSR
jgi:hypothetical protein